MGCTVSHPPPFSTYFLRLRVSMTPFVQRYKLTLAFGPTAAADEFHMLDSMFGNMSPIFPFDTTPSDQDLFRLGLSTNDTANSTSDVLSSQANNTNQGDAFNWSGNAYGGTADLNAAQSHNTAKNEMEGFGAGTGVQGTHGAFDLNSAWAAWTASGAGAAGTGSSESNVIVGNSGTTIGVDTKPVLDANTSGQSAPLRSNSASSALPGPTSRQTAIPSQNMSSAPGQGQVSGQAQNVMQGIGEGPFAMAHPGKEGYRTGRATPSEVYRTVVKP